jgi:hypothetical protein
MKPKTVKSRNCVILAGALLCSGVASAQAASTFITFSVDMSVAIANSSFTPGTSTIEAHGSFNGWGALTLVQQGTSTIYTNTAEDTTDANGSRVDFKYVINGSNWENPASGANRAAQLPATSGASLVLPTPFFGDAGTAQSYDITFQVDVSQQIALGNFIPGTSSVEVRGNFNSWSGGTALTADPTILRTNQYGLVTSNVWKGTVTISGSPNGASAFKYVILNPGTQWESPSSANANSGGNRYFDNLPQTLPVVDYADAPFAPISQVTFNVDMSVVAITDTNYNSASVTLNGDFNGWGSGVAMTNNPSAANTNIYSAVVSSGAGTTINYQYRYTQISSGGTVYDHLNGANGGNGNRTFQVPSINTNLPASMFNDAALNDYFTVATPVLFSVDMNGAVGTEAYAFNASSDAVYINGQFANWYAWSSGINPAAAPAGYRLYEQDLTGIFTNTILIPPGTPVAITYKYGIDPGQINGGPNDDEAGYGTNHYRVVRCTAASPYAMPLDTFGKMTSEPFFSQNDLSGGKLAVGSVSAGKIPVTWLGRPGAHLQVSTDLKTWLDLPKTDGTNWTTGYSSTNGFVSQTNYPVTGNAFFRLVKTK